MGLILSGMPQKSTRDNNNYDGVSMSTVERHRARPSVGAAALTAVAGLLFAIGWVVGILLTGAMWTATAVQVGYRHGRWRG